ncbi:MAG: amidohydrolase [bacterium]
MINLQQDRLFEDEYIILGNIIIGDGNYADYIWVDNGILKDVGKGIPFNSPNNVLMTLIQPDWYIIPGLYDSHIHLKQTALRTLIIDLSNTKSTEDIVEIMSSSNMIGEIKIGMGYDETKFISGDAPTRSDLDRIGDIPAIITRVDCHSCVINTAFIKYADKNGYEISVGDDGILKNEKYSLAYNIAVSSIDNCLINRAIINTCSAALKRGIVAIHTMEGGVKNPIEDAISVKDTVKDLPIRVRVYPQSFDAERVSSEGFSTIGGCILVDGSIGSRTAAISGSYKDSPTESGSLYLDRKTLIPFIEKAGRLGLQVTFHAIGERAIEEVLKAYKSVSEKVSEFRFRIEHFVMATDEQIERAEKLGVCICMQPTFDRLWGYDGGMYEERLGKLKLNRLKSVLRSGIHLAGGSDSNITPMDSILGISSAMSHNNPDERLTFDEALNIFTSGGAYLGFEEKEQGLIRKNFYANFVILDCDPRLKIVNNPYDIHIIATFIDGKPVYISEKFYSCNL